MCTVLALTACSGDRGRSGSRAVTPERPGPSPVAATWPAATEVDHDVISVGFAPHRIDLARGAVWSASLSGAVHRVGVADTSSRLVADAGSSLADVAVSHGRLFVGDNRGRRVLVFDPVSGARERTLRMPGQVRGVLAALGSVWVTAGDAVVRLDPATLNRRSVTEVGGEAAQLALAGTSVLVTNRTDKHVTALDAGGAVVAVTDVHGPSIGVTVTERQIWVLRTDSPTVTVVSRERLLPTGSLTLPGVGYDAAVVGDEVWVTVAETGTVARLSLTGAALGQLTVGRRPLGIAAGSGSVWVANEGESTLWRLSSALATVGP
jgi:hypothetical protein